MVRLILGCVSFLTLLVHYILTFHFSMAVSYGTWLWITRLITLTHGVSGLYSFEGLYRVLTNLETDEVQYLDVYDLADVVFPPPEKDASVFLNGWHTSFINLDGY